MGNLDASSFKMIKELILLSLFICSISDFSFWKHTNDSSDSAKSARNFPAVSVLGITVNSRYLENAGQIVFVCSSLNCEARTKPKYLYQHNKTSHSPFVAFCSFGLFCCPFRFHKNFYRLRLWRTCWQCFRPAQKAHGENNGDYCLKDCFWQCHDGNFVISKQEIYNLISVQSVDNPTLHSDV